MLRVLTIGDIVGKPGRDVLKKRLPALREEYRVDLCVANGENAAGGSGLTAETSSEIFEAGADIITTGDHVWRKKEIIKTMKKGVPILRPENLPEGSPGKGYIIVPTEKGCDVAVVLLLGRVFMEPMDCPFSAVDRVLKRIRGRARVVLVDMHAEATSEKVAMGFHLDGRVSAVFGTHTHVQTADECVLPKGTGYITDLGMTGPVYSVLGRRVDRVLKKFTTGLPTPFDVAGGATKISGALFEIDQTTGRTVAVKRVAVTEPSA